jgi:hypothetical protein
MPPVLAAVAISVAVSAVEYTAGYFLSGGQKLAPQDNARAVDNRVQGSRYGAVIPRLYGTVELAGQVIWATNFRDDVTTVAGSHSKHHPTADQVNHTYRRSFGIQVSAVPKNGSIAGVSRIKFDDKTFYQSATLGPILNARLEIKLGAEDQAPNTWYEADKGVGRVSAHRGYVTVWFFDVDLGPYGDRIPNVRVEVVESVNPTLAHVVDGECLVAELGPGDIDTTELAALTTDGYFVNQQAPVRASLEQLSSAFLFDGPEYDGKIHFRTRPRAAVTTVAWDELGCVEEDEQADTDEPAPRLDLKRLQGAEIASEVSVGYFDKARDYEEGSQPFRRQNLVSGGTATRSYNLIMPPAAALRLAKIIAVVGWAERLPGDIALPPEFFVYVAGDVLSLPTDETEEEFLDFRIEKITFSAPGVVRCSGRRQYAEAYDQSGDEATPGEVPPVVPPVPIPCQSDFWIDDRPPFRWQERNTFGHYIAVSPTGCDPDAGDWPGTVVMRDVDGAGDMRQHAILVDAATMGHATTVLAAGSGLDTTHTVDVLLSSGVAASITDAAFTNDTTLSLWAIGGETCQVRDITDLGGGAYRFSHIRREMFETSSAGHAAGKRVVLLDPQVKRIEHNKDEVGKSFDFYPVTLGDTLENTTPTSFEYGARGVEPGGEAPSAVQDAAVAALNGQQVLQWQPPLANINTLRGYRITIYTDAGMTMPVSDFENVEVSGNQFVLPGQEVL